MAASSTGKKRTTASGRVAAAAPRAKSGPRPTGGRTDMRTQALAEMRLPRTGSKPGIKTQAEVTTPAADETAVVGPAPVVPADTPPGMGWRRLHELPPMAAWTTRVGRWLGVPEASAPTPVPITPQAMADVQAAVMNELALLNRQRIPQGDAMQSQPFGGMPGFGQPDGPVPPRAKDGRYGRRQMGWLAGAVAALLLVMLLGLLMRLTPGPGKALDDIARSLATRDVALFAQHVDVPALAASMADQMLEMVPDTAPGGQVWPTEGVPSGVRAMVGQDARGMRAGLKVYVQGDVAERLQAEVRQAVAQGSFTAVPDGLLAYLWRQAGGARLQVVSVDVNAANTERATAEMLLRRTDMPVTVPVTLVLNKLDGRWQVADVPDLLAAVAQLTPVSVPVAVTPVISPTGPAVPVTLERAKTATRPVLVKAAWVRVDRISKTRTATGELRVQVRLRNRGPVAVRDMAVQVVFADAAGQPMKVVHVMQAAPLASGDSVRAGWTVPVDARRSLERYVRDLPLSALTARGRVLRAEAVPAARAENR